MVHSRETCKRGLTSTSGTIFIIPDTKSCDVPTSDDILSVAFSCTPTSFSLLSVSIVVVAFSLARDVEGMFGGASTAFMSSNFSSNWLKCWTDNANERRHQ